MPSPRPSTVTPPAQPRREHEKMSDLLPWLCRATSEASVGAPCLQDPCLPSVYKFAVQNLRAMTSDVYKPKRNAGRLEALAHHSNIKPFITKLGCIPLSFSCQRRRGGTTWPGAPLQ